MEIKGVIMRYAYSLDIYIAIHQVRLKGTGSPGICVAAAFEKLYKRRLKPSATSTFSSWAMLPQFEQPV